MDKKKIIWGAISLVIAILTIWTIVGQSKYFSFQLLLETFKGCNVLAFCGALLCMFGFIWFEGYALVRIAKHLGYGDTVRRGTLYGAADIFFSAITPSASGGQPASAYFMIKDKMPATAATAALIINLVMYTLALLSIGLIALPLRHRIYDSFSSPSRLIIFIGFLLLVALAVIFYMLLKKGEILAKFCKGCITLLAKIRIIRNAQRKKDKIDAITCDYQDCANIIIGKSRMLVEIFILNVLQRLSQLGVSVMIFISTGYNLMDALDIGIIQCFVAIGSNCFPIPGAMGIADYLMIDGFSGIIGPVAGGSMEMVCRGITFYSCVLISGIIMLYNVLKGKKGRC